MTVDLWVTVLIALIAAVPGGISLAVALRKAPAERTKLNGEASGAYMHAAREAAQDVLEKSKRIDELECAMQALKIALQQTQDELETVKRRLSKEIQQRQKLGRMAKDLYEQVKFIGSDPVVDWEELNGETE